MKCDANILSWGVEFLYLNIGRLSIGVAFISAVGHVIYCWRESKPLALNAAIGKMLAGFVLPPAILMGVATIDLDDLLGCVTNLETYILVGAFSVVWITLTILFPDGLAWRWLTTLGVKFGKKPESS